MLKTLMTATAVSALMVSGALAQQTPAPASPPASRMDTTTPPAAKSDAMKSETKGDAAKAEASLPADAAGKFVSAQGTGHWVASKFKGTDVLGPNNEHIGDVDDLLFDKDGKIVAFIVGVGGFLGIGEKNVALAPSSFQMVPADTRASSNTGSATSTSTSATSDDPNNIKLKVSWTKDQLKSAPAFEYYKAPARTTGTAPGGTTGMAPPAPANR